MTRRAAAIAALAVMLAGSAARADFADGAKAYDGGDYGRAFAAWITLARDGDAEAQVAIAGMYRFGEGQRIDLTEAARWYRRAADLGEPIAQLNLGEMYLLGLGVPRDPVRAHLFLTLATRQGRAWARDRLGALARAMTAGQRELARELLRDWAAR